MRTYLIHTERIGGHQLEYIHHLYMGALARPENYYVFAMPKRFEIDSPRFEWPKSRNIRILILRKEEEVSDDCGLLKKGWVNSKTIRKYAKEYNATDVIAISIMAYLPFLPFFLNRKVRFCGIVYRIYLYEWKDESLGMKFQDALKYWLMSRFRVFYRVFMCNDEVSAHCLNRIFKTDKYRYMPDPVASFMDYNGHSIKDKLKIPLQKRVFLHPGGMSSYKNTLGVLRALLMLDPEVSEKIAVVFAGSVSPEIRSDFDRLYKLVEKKMQIVFIEGYLSFEQFADLFATCDYVLVPYTVKSQSSGIVGHAAYYGKPVIAVKGGILGKMVRNWHLGYQLCQSSDVFICQFLSKIVNDYPCSTKGNSYLDTHTIELFNNTLLSEALNSVN